KPGTQNVEQIVMLTAQDASLRDSSLMKLSTAVRNDIAESYKSEIPSVMSVARDLSTDYSENSLLLKVEEKGYFRIFPAASMQGRC
ncbi:jg27907, partial [Pararge aegeria aegeria]